MYNSDFFHQYKRKGVVQFIAAISELKKQGVIILLDIYGGGERKYIDAVSKEIVKYGVEDQITIKGKVTQKELRVRMSESKAFVMPAINETFGMTYVEAVSVSCPICYVANTGIDGYFDDYEIGVKLNDQSVGAIKGALQEFESNQEIYFEGLKALHEESYMDSFSGKDIAVRYLKK